MEVTSERYGFLVDTYETEILKVLTAWGMFEDGDLAFRLHSADRRGRSVLEHMVHQSVSENLWFKPMLGISVTDDPLPATENRLAFTGGLMQNDAPVIYAYRDLPHMIEEERGSRRKTTLPGPGAASPTERPTL